VTKHSFGIYSTTPTAGAWRRQDPNALQAELDRLPKAPYSETPSGAARIETYTIMHGKAGPEYAIVFGRLDATGERFIANTPAERGVLEDLQAQEGLGRPGSADHRDGRNRFVP
jgi:acetyl-CoA C-acetyltransferase